MKSSLVTTWRMASGALLASLLLCPQAQAALGRAPQAQPAEAATLATESAPVARQMRAVPPSEAYTVSTTVAPTGTVVREFVNAQQVVFAVVWQGPVLPDLAAFFGDHFTAYQQAVQQKRAAGQRGGVVHARKADLVMVSRGRMGHFEGYAYLPALVPHGVDIHTLRP
ncbi:MAG: DUF2844 domain-containing protein [Aquabacterium sp.]|jgi:hypothetical protein|uniref:DUF2844 domain-containing protein n=1 Tax=Aquabacterium sp. TaxID=1872578 RepID=UPI002A367255|nr:DUF2844 domain-containing protein [Aquabacterium sp.]MDX9843972.1 DUF2844 domain-containing protein [Aquabacterium sp.]